MLADDEHVIGQPGQHLRAEIAEAAVAEDRDPVLPPDRELHRDLEGCGHWFGEDGHIVGQRVRHGVQVVLRDGDQIGERAVVVQDAQHRSIRTVGREDPCGRSHTTSRRS